MTVAIALEENGGSRWRALAITAAVGLLLPFGSLIGGFALCLPHAVVTDLFASGLVALLYLVTEELLVEAHRAPEVPIVTSIFFEGS